MQQRVRRTVIAAVMAASWSPTVTHAFQAVDDILWPEERGIFPAYPAVPPDKPVRFSVFSGLMHDDNVFRLSDSTNTLATIGSTSRSDTIFRYGAGIDANVPISRQTILVTARVERRDYDRFDVLDHNAYRLGAAWNWAVGNEWSGDVGYRREHYLSSLIDIQAPIKDMITSDYLYANAGYRLGARWRVRGGVDLYHYNHGDASRSTLDNRTGALTIGADYVTPANNSVGVQFKYTKGNYPNNQPVAPGVAVDNEFKEYETSAVARWVVTGKSTFTGRVGYTERKHDQVAQRDFNGWTGRLEYDWFVANKTLLNFAAWHEIASYADLQASYVVSEGVSFGPSWAPTEKLVLQAKLIHENRDYKGDPSTVASTTPLREDSFDGVRLSAGWTPRRFLELVISADHGKRDSNVFGRDYDFTSVLANARVRF